MNHFFAHPSALVESDDIGKHTRIWAFVHILPGAHIGGNCNIGDHCFIESGAIVGDNVTVKNGNMLWEGVVLEDGVFVGPQVVFTNDLYPRSPRLAQARDRYSQKQNWLVQTRIERGASLGAGAVIRAGVRIGQYALVGSGSVVTRDVPPHAIVRGNPARFAGWVCECGIPLQFATSEATCAQCGLRYHTDSERLTLLSVLPRSSE